MTTDMNPRKLRLIYRKYLFSYTFDVIDPLPLPAFIADDEDD